MNTQTTNLPDTDQGRFLLIRNQKVLLQVHLIEVQRQKNKILIIEMQSSARIVTTVG